MNRDNDILVRLCDGEPGPAPPARLSVDDFIDPAEREITEPEIHLTILAWDGHKENPLACMALSTVSAEALIRELAKAIRHREAEGGGR